MHILQLANFYGPTSGGLRTAVDNLGAQYVARGHRATLIVPDERDEWTMGAPRTVIRIRSPRVPMLGGYRTIVDRQCVREAISVLEPDVIELSDKTTLAGVAAWARERGVPTVLISHERLDAVVDATIWSAGLGRHVVEIINRRQLARSDAVVCASRFAAAEFDLLAAGVRHIPLGVDLDRFQPATGQPRATPPNLIAAVRLSPEKHPWLLVDTSRELVARGVDHRLSVYGDGPLRMRLIRSARGLPVRFEGHTNDRRRLAWAMATADAAIAPGPLETFGLAALEMLASGTPIVVPARGALAELVTEGTGVAAEPTAEAFADAVVALLDGDREHQRRLARARAEEFTWERAGARMLDVFGEVVSAPRRRHELLSAPARSYL